MKTITREEFAGKEISVAVLNAAPFAVDSEETEKCVLDTIHRADSFKVLYEADNEVYETAAQQLGFDTLHLCARPFRIIVCYDGHGAEIMKFVLTGDNPFCN